MQWISDHPLIWVGECLHNPSTHGTLITLFASSHPVIILLILMFLTSLCMIVQVWYRNIAMVFKCISCCLGSCRKCCPGSSGASNGNSDSSRKRDESIIGRLEKRFKAKEEEAKKGAEAAAIGQPQVQ
jgi:hypothetical protein